jgi:hypothetical protein
MFLLRVGRAPFVLISTLCHDRRKRSNLDSALHVLLYVVSFDSWTESKFIKQPQVLSPPNLCDYLTESMSRTPSLSSRLVVLAPPLPTGFHQHLVATRQANKHQPAVYRLLHMEAEDGSVVVG